MAGTECGYDAVGSVAGKVEGGGSENKQALGRLIGGGLVTISLHDNEWDL